MISKNSLAKFVAQLNATPQRDIRVSKSGTIIGERVINVPAPIIVNQRISNFNGAFVRLHFPSRGRTARAVQIHAQLSELLNSMEILEYRLALWN